jgi:hypothetical protein
MQSASLPAAPAQTDVSNIVDRTWPKGIVTAGSVSFIRDHWLRLSIVSAFVLAPCFWHSRLVAGDLGSHLYNAWLIQLIRHGQTSGLWVANQWNNVLFDHLLSGLVSIFPPTVAARIAASLSALIFFWGVFAFLHVATRRPPWFLVPLIAVFTYGWTFQEGIFNYHLSLGLAFVGLAAFWKSHGWQRILVLALSSLIAVAHPLGLAWFLGGAIYIWIAELIPLRFHVLVILATASVLASAHQFLWHHYRVESRAHSVLFYSGLDQLIFTNRYVIPAAALAAFAALAVAVDIIKRRHEQNLFAPYAIPLGLYLVAETGVFLLPDAVWWPQYAAPTSLLTERFTLISGALLCCLLAALSPRKWHLAALTAIAATFFLFLYQDTAALNRMEEHAEQLVHTVPPGQRILVTIGSPMKYRFSTKHIVDQACVGYCFSYGNYEAPSGQFRIRALPGNAFVMSRIEDAAAMERGQYVVRPQDLPAAQVYQCGPTWMNLCLHPLQSGEMNDHLGFHPELGIYPKTDVK